MFKQNTVIVLGAGASKPYGFPTGGEILAHITSGESWQKLETLRDSPSPSNMRDLRSDYENLSKKIRDAPHDSIDQILSRWPNLSRIGKYVIAVEILNAELRSQRHLGQHDKQHWYATLFRRLTDGVNGQEKVGLLKQNRLSIITFNYDRSLDFFLFKNLMNFLDIQDPSPLVEYFKSIRIIHVYGRIADPFDLKSHQYFPYGSTPSYNDVLRLSENINVMYSSRSNAVTAEIHPLILSAERVFFFGFGYHDSNFELLGLPQRPATNFWGTTKDLPRGKIDSLRKRLHTKHPNGGDRYFNSFCFEPEDCGEFANHYLF